MVISRVPSIEVTGVARAGELLAVGGFPQCADGVSDGLKS